MEMEKRGEFFLRAGMPLHRLWTTKQKNRVVKKKKICLGTVHGHVFVGS